MSLTPTTSEQTESPANPSRRTLAIRIGIGAVVLLAVGVWLWPSSGVVSTGTTFPARQGNLDITVLEMGEIEALESQVIQSRVRGQTKILSIVEEGYRVTPEDVRDGLVLVTLDDADLQERLTQAEIQYQNSIASLTESREQYEIQVKQNESDIKAAELDMRFARLDFERYLGAELANRIISDLNLDEIEREVLSGNTRASGTIEIDSLMPGPGASGEGGPRPRGQGRPSAGQGSRPSIPLTPDLIDAIGKAFQDQGLPGGPEQLLERAERNEDGQPMLSGRMLRGLESMGVDVASIVGDSGPIGTIPQPDTEPDPADLLSPPEPSITTTLGERGDIQFADYLDLDRLEDGEAKQTLRRLNDTKLVAEEELSIARNHLDGTKLLAERDFVRQSDLETDQMRVTRGEISVEAANTELDLFIRYEFPKQCEKLLSDYEEALRRLERAQKLAVSRLAQAQAKLRSAESQYNLNSQRRDELLEQVELAVIRAERPGLVVYGAVSQRGNQEPIQEGASIREMQEIIIIPDMTKMGAKVSIHESAMKKVQQGLPVRVRVEAYPDDLLKGEVTRVSVLPDSQNRWMNPDVRVYTTTIRIDGVHDWLRPGMSAEIEILVEELQDVVYVPLQAVMSSTQGRVVYVATASGPEARPVETGEFNNEFIEIRSGLAAGEKVHLRRPSQFQFEDRFEPGDEYLEEAPDIAAPEAVAHSGSSDS